MNCSICHQPGHNKKSCKNEPVEQEPKEKKPRGRPRKKKVTEDDIVEEVRVRAENEPVVQDDRDVGGSNVVEEVRPVNVVRSRKKTVAKSGPRKNTAASSGSKQRKNTAASSGLNRNGLKRSCMSAFARWFGEPEDEMDQQTNVMDAGVTVEDEVQVEIDLTGTQVEDQMEETQTQGNVSCTTYSTQVHKSLH